MDGSRREIIRALKLQGWSVETTKQQHLRCISPQGDVVIAGGMHGNIDQHATRNWIAELKKYGFIWREKKGKKRHAKELAEEQPKAVPDRRPVA